jgi:starvation-inducible DNA-binding protein
MAAVQKRGGSGNALSAHRQQLVKGKAVWQQRVRRLHRDLANAFILYTNYKQYHWQTYSPGFRDLHLVFGDFAKEVLDSIDHLAQRIHVIGQDLPAHLLEAMELARVSAAAPPSTMRAMVEEADRNVRVVVKELRDAARIAGEHGDQGTFEVVSRLIVIYERHEGCLRDILNKRPGPQLA